MSDSVLGRGQADALGVGPQEAGRLRFDTQQDAFDYARDFLKKINSGTMPRKFWFVENDHDGEVPEERHAAWGEPIDGKFIFLFVPGGFEEVAGAGFNNAKCEYAGCLNGGRDEQSVFLFGRQFIQGVKGIIPTLMRVPALVRLKLPNEVPNMGVNAAAVFPAEVTLKSDWRVAKWELDPPDVSGGV